MSFDPVLTILPVSLNCPRGVEWGEVGADGVAETITAVSSQIVYGDRLMVFIHMTWFFNVVHWNI
ncbi:MAG: hypothetical protein R3C20_09585 [Planctomycetaceae bacterium]